MKVKISRLLGTMILCSGIITQLHGQLEEAVFACNQETISANWLQAPNNRLTAYNVCIYRMDLVAAVYNDSHKALLLGKLNNGNLAIGDNDISDKGVVNTKLGGLQISEGNPVELLVSLDGTIPQRPWSHLIRSAADQAEIPFLTANGDNATATGQRFRIARGVDYSPLLNNPAVLRTLFLVPVTVPYASTVQNSPIAMLGSTAGTIEYQLNNAISSFIVSLAQLQASKKKQQEEQEKLVLQQKEQEEKLARQQAEKEKLARQQKQEEQEKLALQQKEQEEKLALQQAEKEKLAQQQKQEEQEKLVLQQKKLEEKLARQQAEQEKIVQQQEEAAKKEAAAKNIPTTEPITPATIPAGRTIQVQVYLPGKIVLDDVTIPGEIVQKGSQEEYRYLDSVLHKEHSNMTSFDI